VSYVLIQRLTAVRDEFRVARAAVTFAERTWPQSGGEPEFHGARMEHVRLTVRNLQGTYVIRLFAEFEELLRYYLEYRHPQRRLPRTAEALINRVALLEHLPDAAREGAHEVRQYRNSLVHVGAVTAPLLDFDRALSSLNRYLAPLPDPP